jgi:hypothetical protein
MASTIAPTPEAGKPAEVPFVERYAALLTTVGQGATISKGDPNTTGEDQNVTYYRHGEAKIAINPDKLAEAMDNIDKAGPDNYRKHALAIGLPVDPFSPKLLRPVLMGDFQIVWHRWKNQPEEALVQIKEKQAGRVKHYLIELQEAKNKPVTAPKTSDGVKDAVRVGRGGGGGGTKRAGSGSVYRFDPAKKDIWGKFDKQKGIVVKAFETAGGSASAAKLVELINLLPEGQKMTTNQPVERVVSFYLAEWKRNGLVLTSDAPPTETKTPDPEPVVEKEQEKESVSAAPAGHQGGAVPAGEKPDTSKLDTSTKKKNGKKK